jgi:FkbM family methyltransferase
MVSGIVVPLVADVKFSGRTSIAQHYIVEVFRRLKTYSLSSLPYYSLDYLGFRVPAFRRLAKFKLIHYRLYDGTRFIVRPFTHDRCIIDEIFVNKVYTPDPTFEVRSGDVVVDIGAHIGVFTIFAARRGCEVYCYEPLPENFALLKLNVHLNNLNDRVRMFQLALAGTRGLLPLRVSARGLASFRLQGERRTIVRAILLEDVINNVGRVDFLKMDVEGAEREIFLRNDLNKNVLHVISRIAMECHSLRDTIGIKDLLKSNGFAVSIRKGGHPSLFYIYAARDRQ